MKVWGLFEEKDDSYPNLLGLFLQIHKAQEEAEEQFVASLKKANSENYKWSSKRYFARRQDSDNLYLYVKLYSGDWHWTGAYIVQLEVVE